MKKKKLFDINFTNKTIYLAFGLKYLNFEKRWRKKKIELLYQISQSWTIHKVQANRKYQMTFMRIIS